MNIVPQAQMVHCMRRYGWTRRAIAEFLGMSVHQVLNRELRGWRDRMVIRCAQTEADDA